MSHAGPPSDPPPPDPNQPDSAQPDPYQQSPEPAPYSPYPDNWNAPTPPPGPPNPYAAQPDPYAQANPYGQQSPYAAPGQPGSPANPYAGAATTKPTFHFSGYAGWFARVAAFVIDYILYLVSGAPAIVGEVILFQNSTTTTDAQGVTHLHYHYTGTSTGLLLIGSVTGLAFGIWNICIRQGRTGATIGKSVLAIRLVNSDLQPIGGGWAFLRFLLHILDYLPCFIGFLWPLWDSRKQTFADKIMSTFVIHATQEPRPY